MRAKDSVAPLVCTDHPCNSKLRLESRKNLDMGASLSRNGCWLPNKCSPVRANPLLRYRTPLHSRSRLRRNAGFGIVPLHPGLFLLVVFGACCRKYLVVDGEYIWKYTHNGYDFGVVAASPIAFPIAWHNSKIPGYTLRVSVPNYHGFTALVVMSSVAARFFPPQVGGVPFLPAPGVFRIDHDEKFNQTTHFQYQLNDDEALSRGILSNNARSTSV